MAETGVNFAPLFQEIFKIHFFGGTVALQCCVSAVQQSESAIYLPMSPLFLDFLPI